MRAMILPRRYGPIVNNPSIPPTIASPHAFRFTATKPPTSAKIEMIHPIIPQVTRIDWSCSTEMGESTGSTF